MLTDDEIDQAIADANAAQICHGNAGQVAWYDGRVTTWKADPANVPPGAQVIAQWNPLANQWVRTAPRQTPAAAASPAPPPSPGRPTMQEIDDAVAWANRYSKNWSTTTYPFVSIEKATGDVDVMLRGTSSGHYCVGQWDHAANRYVPNYSAAVNAPAQPPTIVTSTTGITFDTEDFLRRASPKPCSYCETPPGAEHAPRCIFRLGAEREAREAAKGEG